MSSPDVGLPTVTTNQLDYAPGSEAVFTATGFDPDSTIEFSVQTLLGDGSYSAPVTWFVTDTSGTGDVSTPFYVGSAYAGTNDLLTATEVTINPDGGVTPVGPTASTTFTDNLSASISILKVATTTPENPADVDANGAEADYAGQVIDYTVTVTNTGSAVLTNVTVADLLPGVTLSGGVGTLYPSGIPGYPLSEVLTGSLVVTQAEIDAGTIRRFRSSRRRRRRRPSPATRPTRSTRRGRRSTTRLRCRTPATRR